MVFAQSDTPAERSPPLRQRCLFGQRVHLVLLNAFGSLSGVMKTSSSVLDLQVIDALQEDDVLLHILGLSSYPCDGPRDARNRDVERSSDVLHALPLPEKSEYFPSPVRSVFPSNSTSRLSHGHEIRFISAIIIHNSYRLFFYTCARCSNIGGPYAAGRRNEL